MPICNLRKISESNKFSQRLLVIYFHFDYLFIYWMKWNATRNKTKILHQRFHIFCSPYRLASKGCYRMGRYLRNRYRKKNENKNQSKTNNRMKYSSVLYSHTKINNRIWPVFFVFFFFFCCFFIPFLFFLFFLHIHVTDTNLARRLMTDSMCQLMLSYSVDDTSDIFLSFPFLVMTEIYVAPFNILCY